MLGRRRRTRRVLEEAAEAAAEEADEEEKEHIRRRLLRGFIIRMPVVMMVCYVRLRSLIRVPLRFLLRVLGLSLLSSEERRRRRRLAGEKALAGMSSKYRLRIGYGWGWLCLVVIVLEWDQFNSITSMYPRCPPPRTACLYATVPRLGTLG